LKKNSISYIAKYTETYSKVEFRKFSQGDTSQPPFEGQGKGRRWEKGQREGVEWKENGEHPPTSFSFRSKVTLFCFAQLQDCLYYNWTHHNNC